MITRIKVVNNELTWRGMPLSDHPDSIQGFLSDTKKNPGKLEKLYRKWLECGKKDLSGRYGLMLKEKPLTGKEKTWESH
jgi:hypothetical protein